MPLLADEVTAFLSAVDARGGDRGDFQMARGRRSVDDDPEDEILEITFLPTGITLRYDVHVLRWSLLAIADYRSGKFERTA